MNTLTVELDSMERMLIQIELTVMAGDHESYRISAKFNICKLWEASSVRKTVIPKKHRWSMWLLSGMDRKGIIFFQFNWKRAFMNHLIMTASCFPNNLNIYLSHFIFSQPQCYEAVPTVEASLKQPFLVIVHFCNDLGGGLSYEIDSVPW